LLFPVLFPALLVATWWGIQLGYKPLAVFAVLSVVHFIVMLTLEQLLPARHDWQQSDHQQVHDLAHGALGAVGGKLGQLINDNGIVVVGTTLAGALGMTALWPTSWALVPQVLVGLLVVDLARYGQHRALHRVPLLWRFHALHHDSERLAVWKGPRAHPVERLTQTVCMFGPFALLGASADVAFWCLAINSFIGTFDHANVDVRIGKLGWLICGPEQHRIHHSKALDEGNMNFASALNVWDHVFGTFVDPHKRPPIIATGVPEARPRTFGAQFFAPFRPGPAVPVTSSMAPSTPPA
jgi:sterol desaturase/sphingolipid hydroxylase (fatty acid hydroxylase superfamily)